MSTIAHLLESPHTFAVVGASRDPSKYGYEVIEALVAHGHHVLPINPKYEKINCQTCYPSLLAIKSNPDVVVTAAPATLSAKIAETCGVLEIPFFWMPPGTESEEALENCRKYNVTAIHGFCPVFVMKMDRRRWHELP